MFFEFQLSADTLAHIVRNQLHNSDLYVSEPFPYQGDMLMVDRLHVLETTSLGRKNANFTVQTSGGAQNVQGNKAVLSQPIRIDMVKVSDLIANGISATPPHLSVEIKVLLGITAFVDNGVAKLQFAFDSLDFGLAGLFIGQATQQQITNTVSSKVPPITRTIDIGAVQGLLGGATLTVTNAGATATSGGEVLILRLEVNGDGNQLATWTYFYSTYDRNHVGERNWALLVDQELLRQSIISQLTGQLAASGDTFALDGNVNATWAPAQGAVFNVSFSGEVIDACTCFWGEIDLNVDVDTSVTLSVPSTDLLRLRLHTEYDADNLEVFCCALTAALFWPVVGIIYMTKDKVNFGQYMLGWLGGPLGVFIAACVIAGNQSVADSMGSGSNCNKVDDETIDCDQPFSLNMGALGGSYHLNTISAQPDGPVLAGTTTGIQNLADPLLQINSFSEFNWHLGGSCSKGFSAVQSGGFIYLNSVWGSILKIGEVTVFDDPLNIFAVKRDTDRVTVTPYITDAYLANPYPCKLRMITNGGVRIITFAPATQITSEQSKALGFAAIAAKGHCYVLINKLPWSIAKYRWLPDPAPDLEISQLWQVVVSEMQQREAIELVGAKEQVLGSAVAGVRGVAQLSYWAEPGHALDEITLRIQGAEAPSRTTAKNAEVKRHVSVRQVQFVLRSRIPVHGDFLKLALQREDRNTVVTVHTSTGEQCYDITHAESPSLLSHTVTRTEGVIKMSREAVPALAGQTGGHEALGVFHRYIAKGLSLEAYDRRMPSGEKKLLEKVTAHPIERLEPVKVAGVKEAVCIKDGKGAFNVLDLSDHKNVNVIGHYYHSPWFFESKRIGELFVKLAPNRRELCIYEVHRIREI